IQCISQSLVCVMFYISNTIIMKIGCYGSINSISRTIVYNDKLPMNVRLREYAFYRTMNERCLIVYRCDDGNTGFGHFLIVMVYIFSTQLNLISYFKR